MREGRRSFRIGLSGSGVLALALLVGSCGDGGTGPGDVDVDGEVTVTEPVLVTASSQSMVSVERPYGARIQATQSAARPVGSILQDGVSYISFPPGSMLKGDSVEIQNQRTGGMAGGPVVDGGLDPVGIPAEVGDELQITVLALGEMNPVKRFVRLVPDEKPPVVVRTDPRRRRTKVPLNKAIDIIFSEPIALSSVNSESVQLLEGEEVVSAEVSVLEGGLLVQVSPLAPLKPATTYSISVAPAVRDLAGSALSSAFESEFTTTGEVGSIEVITETSRGGTLETDGYSILLDGVQGPHIGVQDTVVLNNVGAGLHNVSLAGMAPHCSQRVPGDVTVSAHDTTTIVLPVVCYPGRLDLEIAFSPENNYPWNIVVLMWNDSVRWEVPVGLFSGSGARTLSGFWGETKLELILPKNCVAEDNPRTFFQPEAELATLKFEVSCYSAYLEVTTVTSGVGTDSDGYQLSVDGAEAFPFGANEERILYGVQPGDRVLELTGIESHCTLSGDNPRTVTVGALDEGGSTTFELVCSSGDPPQD